jgi:gliding motility-associated-like protein
LGAGANIFQWTISNPPCSPSSSQVTITFGSSITPFFTAVAPICSGDALAPLPTTSNNSITGTWSPALNNTATTTYTFTPDANQCATTTTLTITVNPNVTPTFTAVTPICSGDALAPLPTTSNNSITGTWSPILNNTATTTYTFTPDANQCATTTTLTITLNPTPGLVITDPTPVCSPNTVDITATSVTMGSTGGGVLSYWTNPLATNLLATPNAVANSATYYIQTITAAGCKDIKPVTVLINTTPVLVVTNPISVCSPNTVNITASSVTTGSTGGGVLSYWNDAAATSALLSPNAITTSGTYYIQTTTAAGCKDIKPVTVTINPSPTPLFSTSNPSGCSPVCVNFMDISTVTSGTITAWNWNFGGIATSTSQNANYCFTTTGQHQVTLSTTTTNGCTPVSNPTIINVFQSPDADFNPSPNSISIFDSIVTMNNQSSLDVTNWYWDFGNGVTLSPNIPNPTYGYPIGVETNYTITLIVQNASGCYDTITREITVNPEFTFYIPNTFSPDNDGKNDTFFGKGIGISEYELSIYDRWGELIFRTEDINEGWNGIAKNGNKVAQQDVYVWKVNLKDVLHKRHDYIGTVTIIK